MISGSCTASATAIRWSFGVRLKRSDKFYRRFLTLAYNFVLRKYFDVIRGMPTAVSGSTAKNSLPSFVMKNGLIRL